MTYGTDDVQQILQRALTRQQQGEFSREQLVEMATELGISPETLQAAEQDWLANRDQEKERQAFNTYLRKSFKAHLIPYLAVNTFLILINLTTSPGYLWAVYPILGWGLGLFFHGWGAYHTEGPAYEKMFQKWCKLRAKYG
ncbi:2TM domain-containing protein [Leptothermofonsia sp. ETS-13]|uniref:2TM domain-containing protein n=1 Tax=Leptothermofonsia sp. ETS-13 TaxID=3035696 RepID=UPI003BA34CD7